METPVCLFKKGDIIYQEGSFEMWMYDLKRGTVGIYANYGQPDEFLLTKVMGAPGATIGTIGLIDSMCRSATAVALDDVEAIKVSGEAFADYYGNDPEALLNMMRKMSKRIRELTAGYLETCKALSELTEKDEDDKPGSGGFMEKISKFIKDYADAIASISETGNIYYPYGGIR